MKKVLILAYDFPPYVSVGGLRPKAWFDHLKKLGIEPIVVTRQWENQYGNHLDYVVPSTSKVRKTEIADEGTIIRTPYKPNLSNLLLTKYGDSKFRLIRKGITGLYELAQYFLPIGTKRELYSAARDYMSKNKVDCVLATGDPFVLFHYANKLSSEFNTPWIADYRDPWSHEFENSGSFFQKKWSRYLEKKIVRHAFAITTVSQLLKNKIHAVTHHENIYVHSNGYDSEALDKVFVQQQNSSKLKIGFAGSIYFWNPIDDFLKTLSEFCSENLETNTELHFYGVNTENELKEKIKNYYPFLISKIHFTSRIPNHELLKELSDCNVLLLFNHYSILGTKIFDYLALRRKILLCYTADEDSRILKSKHFPLAESASQSNKLQADLIAETNSGIAVKDGEHLKLVLKELSSEFKQTGQIACNSVHVENYSRKIQVQKLAELIKSIC